MDRRERFREYIAAFNITDPRSAFEAGRYVPVPGESLGQRLAARADIFHEAIQFVVGGIGVGKTTQMLVAKRELDASSEFVARHIDVATVHNLGELTPSLLLTLAGLELCEAVVPTSPKVEEAIKAIKGHALGQWVDPHADDDEPPPEWYRFDWHDGILKAPLEVDRHVALLEPHVRTLLDALGSRRFVALFDGLDRSHNPEALLTLLRQDVAAMQRLGLGAAMVVPERMLFGTARSFLDQFEWQSLTAVDVREQRGQAFLNEVLTRRAPQGLLTIGAAARVVPMCGGVLRDLIALARAAGEEAYVRGAERVEAEHVEVAVDRFARKQIFGLSKEQLAALKRVDKSGEFIETNNGDVELLVTGRVLQYARPQSKFVIHPALATLIRKLDQAA